MNKQIFIHLMNQLIDQHSEKKEWNTIKNDGNDWLIWNVPLTHWEQYNVEQFKRKYSNLKFIKGKIETDDDVKEMKEILNVDDDINKID